MSLSATLRTMALCLWTAKSHRGRMRTATAPLVFLARLRATSRRLRLPARLYAMTLPGMRLVALVLAWQLPMTLCFLAARHGLAPLLWATRVGRAGKFATRPCALPVLVSCMTFPAKLTSACPAATMKRHARVASKRAICINSVFCRISSSAVLCSCRCAAACWPSILARPCHRRHTAGWVDGHSARPLLLYPQGSECR